MGRRLGFTAIWVATFVGFPLGGLAARVVGPIKAFGPALLGGGLAGAVIGLVQWLVLRRYRERVGWWAPATAAGMSLGTAVGGALVGYGTEIGELVVRGAATGTAVGALQALVLRCGTPGAAAWALANAVLWPLGWLVTARIGVDVEAQYTNFGSSGALVVTALSGLLLSRLIGRPGAHVTR
jgi:hypothetical protein